jgi:hypothetical protein
MYVGRKRKDGCTPKAHFAISRTVSGSIPSGVTLGIFSVATDGTMCPGVDSASKNEYQGFPLGVKVAGAWGLRLITLVVPNVKKSGALTYPEPPWAISACCGRDLYLTPKASPRVSWVTLRHLLEQKD